MSALHPVQLYDVASSIVCAVGLTYLLDNVVRNHGYRWPLVVITFSVFGLVATDLFTTLVTPEFGELLAVVPLLGIVFGLAGLVDAGHERADWASLVADDPVEVRHPEEWMRPLDDHILSLFHSTHLVLTPSLVAYNLDYSRSEVSRRLSKLVEAGYVHRVETGKYRLTSEGESYLQHPSVQPRELVGELASTTDDD